MNAVNKAGQFTIDEQRTIFKIKIILHMYVLYNVTYIYLTWTKWNNSEKNQSLPIKHRKMRKIPRLFHKNLYLRGKERIWNLEYECAFSAWCSCLLIAGRLADWVPGHSCYTQLWTSCQWWTWQNKAHCHAAFWYGDYKTFSKHL